MLMFSLIVLKTNVIMFANGVFSAIVSLAGLHRTPLTEHAQMFMLNGPEPEQMITETEPEPEHM